MHASSGDFRDCRRRTVSDTRTFPEWDLHIKQRTFTARGGVRAFVGDRVTIGVDMRVGWELHVRVNGLVRLQLGR